MSKQLHGHECKQKRPFPQPDTEKHRLHESSWKTKRWENFLAYALSFSIRCFSFSRKFSASCCAVHPDAQLFIWSRSFKTRNAPESQTSVSELCVRLVKLAAKNKSCLEEEGNKVRTNWISVIEFPSFYPCSKKQKNREPSECGQWEIRSLIQWIQIRERLSDGNMRLIRATRQS